MSEIKKLVGQYSNVLILRSSKNVGVATAFNNIASYFYKKDYKWLLTLDQDSVCPNGFVKGLLKYQTYEKLAILCPRIVDRRQEYRYAFKKEPKEGIQEIARCITSGSIINLEILKKLGGFDDTLFIDYVDYEYCKRVILNKYKILRINSVILDQQLGDMKFSKHKRLYIQLGKITHSRIIMSFACKKNYNPLRRYYCARNHVYYMKKYRKHCNICKELASSLYTFIKILILGRKKIELIKAMARGLRDGIRMDVKPYYPGVQINADEKDY